MIKVIYLSMHLFISQCMPHFIQVINKKQKKSFYLKDVNIVLGKITNTNTFSFSILFVLFLFNFLNTFFFPIYIAFISFPILSFLFSNKVLVLVLILFFNKVLIPFLTRFFLSSFNKVLLLVLF